ncbi:hypothetical protein [Vibrio sp. SCSIO 43136]|uniref:protein kinase domain-containing protein n=1 Tax=Vibrio sp. SCSIO 43136 TaxID=2819101 RepID=UPI0020755C68|nr:hypothetical protein [Vibrio sp. SCSIO 43136]USD66353.1 protein kinase family protein [Vibrio sp. SCSIO 43136]
MSVSELFDTTLPAGERCWLSPQVCKLTTPQGPLKVKLAQGVVESQILSHEALVLQRVRHVSVAPTLLHFDKVGQQALLLCDWCEGEPLSKYTDIELPAHSWIALLDTIRQLHQAGYLHGDVKCSNIIVDSNQVLKLIDFASARRLGEPMSLRGVRHYSPSYQLPQPLHLADGVIDEYAFLVCMAKKLGVALTTGWISTLAAEFEHSSPELVRQIEQIQTKLDEFQTSVY